MWYDKLPLTEEPMNHGIDEKTQKKIIVLIAALIPEAKIYLFGSRARGRFAQWSDIDLALDAGKRLPNVVVDEVKSVLNNTNIPYKIDVVDLYFVTDEMKDSILQEGIVWKA